MQKKNFIELLISIFLIFLGSLLLVFPLLKITNIKWILNGVFIFYIIMNLIKFIYTKKDKDYEGLYVMIASIISLIISLVIDVSVEAWNLAITLFSWIIFLSLIKLKKCDFYNDKKNNFWQIEFVSLVLFVLTGVLATINLYYEENVQILVLGFFFFIHGILELDDPLRIYISKLKK